jgi:hypothetical protein
VPAAIHAIGFLWSKRPVSGDVTKPGTAALSSGDRSVGQVTHQNDASGSRRPQTHPKHGPGDDALGGLELGSSVRSPAKLTLASVMVRPYLLPGRAVCHALGPGGRWTLRSRDRPSIMVTLRCCGAAIICHRLPELAARRRLRPEGRPGRPASRRSTPPGGCGSSPSGDRTPAAARVGQSAMGSNDNTRGRGRGHHRVTMRSGLLVSVGGLPRVAAGGAGVAAEVPLPMSTARARTASAWSASSSSRRTSGAAPISPTSRARRPVRRTRRLKSFESRDGGRHRRVYRPPTSRPWVSRP